MADALSDFYSGGMQAPNRVGNQLVPSSTVAPTLSVQQMYAGMPYAPAPAGALGATGTYAAAPPHNGAVTLAPMLTAEGLAIHPVTSVQVDARGNPILTASGTAHTVDAANPLDVTALGLTNDPFRPSTHAQQAIEAAAPPQPPSLQHLFAGIGLTGHVAGGLQHTPQTMTIKPAVGDAWDGMRIGTPPVAPPGLATGTVVPPASIAPASSIAAMYHAPPTYDPRVDVTGMAQQQGPGQNAGGWGINAGGGIVAF